MEKQVFHAFYCTTRLRSLTQEFSEEFPLAKYSAQYWNDHLLAENGEAHPPPIPLAPELFLSEEKTRNWIALYDFDGNVSTRNEPPPDSPGSPLYYAVLTGLKIPVETLIVFHEVMDWQAEAPNGNNLEHPDTDDGSAAPQYMSKYAYVNATGGTLHTTLQAASWLGMIDTVELLIKHGADLNVYGGCESGSALSAVAHNGYLDIMELLLDTGADLYEGILSGTSDSSKESNMRNSDAKNDTEQEDEAIDETVKQEVDTPSKGREKLADNEKNYKNEIKPPVDAPDRRALEHCRRTAIFEAASFGDVEMFNFMLDRGAMINLRNDKRGETALVKAPGTDKTRLSKLYWRVAH